MGVEAKSSGRLPMAASRLFAVPVPGSRRVPATASSREVSTLPVASALAPARRATARISEAAAAAALSSARSHWNRATPAAGAREQEQHDGHGEHLSEARDQPGLLARAGGRALLLDVGLRAGGREEVALDHGQRGAGARPPVQRAGQPDAAVELAVRPAQAVPRVRRRAQVVQDPTAVDVVLQPPAQARPGPGEGLVGDLQDAVVAGDEPRRDEHLDQPVARGVRADRAAAGPGCAPAPPQAPGESRRSTRSRSASRRSGSTWA